MKETITQKTVEYVNRAEELKPIVEAGTHKKKPVAQGDSGSSVDEEKNKRHEALDGPFPRFYR